MTEDDGRYIDERLGVLEGAGAQQHIVPAPPSPEETTAWARDSSSAPEKASYYERPLLKDPVWIWSVPAYFYSGGMAGAAAVLGAVAQAVDGRGLGRLVRRCRWLACAGAGIGTVFLIIDLGRPERWLNMLRVFRPSSPLNIGSWILAAETPLASGAAVLAGANGRLRRLGDLAGLGAGLVGLPMSGYTAVLLSNTAVPVWQSARRSLPFLFVASAASSATALLKLTELAEREYRIVDRFSTVAGTAELIASAAVEREAGTVERVARPLREGLSGTLWKTSAACTGAGLLISMLPGDSRRRRITAAVLGTAGSVAMRFAVFHAGKKSARDPHATFEMQRRGHEGAVADPGS